MRNSIKIIFAISFFLLVSIKSLGQQTPHYTQYIYNTQLFNPAYVGSKDYLSLTLSSRLQWVDIDGAPQTHAISSHKNLEKWPVGVGASLALDRLGPVDQKNINIDFSYTIRPTEKTKLAFGLKLGGEILTVNLSRGSSQNPD